MFFFYKNNDNFNIQRILIKQLKGIHLSLLIIHFLESKVLYVFNIITKNVLD